MDCTTKSDKVKLTDGSGATAFTGAGQVVGKIDASSNPDTVKFGGGHDVTIETVDLVKTDNIFGAITFSGGREIAIKLGSVSNANALNVTDGKEIIFGSMVQPTDNAGTIIFAGSGEAVTGTIGLASNLSAVSIGGKSVTFADVDQTTPLTKLDNVVVNAPAAKAIVLTDEDDELTDDFDSIAWSSEDEDSTDLSGDNTEESE